MHTMMVITAAATVEMNPVANTDVITRWTRRKHAVQQMQVFNTNDVFVSLQVPCIELYDNNLFQHTLCVYKMSAAHTVMYAVTNCPHSKQKREKPFL